jgi:hypothetical protein
MRLCNLVTLRRMFLAVSTVSEIFSPLQQQILDPVANIKFLRHHPAQEDTVDGGVKLKLSSESLKNFCDRNILNTLQLLTISCLLQMRQGFQLVQGRSFHHEYSYQVCILLEQRIMFLTEGILGLLFTMYSLLHVQVHLELGRYAQLPTICF